MWGIWHLPILFIDGSYQASLWGRHPIFAINFFVGIIPLAFIMNYLYYRNRRSIALITLFHILINYSSEIFEANQISKCIFTLILAAVAVALVLRNRAFFFTEKMNLVLALEGIPRALFMLFGGAITDRVSPRAVLIVSDIVRFVLAALMTVVVVAGVVEMWMLYAFSLGFGLVAGFAVPAGNSIVPMVVVENDLQAGNSIVMGGGQFVGFVGPVLAGILIGSTAESLRGIGLAFGIDAATFAVSAIFLGMMRAGGQLASAGSGANKESVWNAIVAGMIYVWQNEALRLMFFVIAAVNFLFVGPILAGIPVLAGGLIVLVTFWAASQPALGTFSEDVLAGA